jgi:hypothetical protein
VQKDRRVPALEDLPRIFDYKFFQYLVQTKLLPAEIEIPRFTEGVLEAARIYVRDAGEFTNNDVHHEVDRLLRAANRANDARKRKDVSYTSVAVQLERLSDRTRKLLNNRGMLPEPETVRNPATQRKACETIGRICRIGACWQEGRRRPGGKRSVTMVSVLHAPALQQQPARRETQRNFVMWLRTAYLEAAGKPPPRTAHSDRPSAFARVVQTCLHKLGTGANAVEMLNELQRRRNEMESQHTSKKTQLRKRLSRQKS